MSNFAQIEDIIFAALKTTAPAVTLAVVHPETKQPVRKGYGFIDPETMRQPVMHDTLFDLASVTKLYTVTVFLTLVAEGKTQLDAPVISVVPEFGKYGIRPIESGQNPHTLEREIGAGSGTADPAQVTFRHLLTHTSGLAPWRDLFLNVGPVPPLPGISDPVSRNARIDLALDLIASYGYVSQPGEHVNYSDLGLITLGVACERLGGAPLAQLIAERTGIAGVCFNPGDTPGMSALCAPTELDERWRKRRCQAEVHDENACALGGIAGHAGLFGSAEAVAALGIWWLNALAGNQPRLPQALAREAVRPHVENRGFGWVTFAEDHSCGPSFSPSSFGHTGFTGTSLWVDPERELIVALLTNRVYYGRDADAIVAFRPDLHRAITSWIDAL